jgi:ribonuclease-3
VEENLPHTDSLEQLEFLGDAVIGLVTAEFLLEEHPECDEGELAKLKSLVVSGEVLSERADKLGLGKLLLMSEGEIRSGGREKPSILEDSYEAVVGAIYIDGGLKTASQFIRKHLLSHTDKFKNSDNHRNYKSIILEHAQAEYATQPKYRVLNEFGPDHEKIYRIEISIDGEPMGVGEGTSKKRAEQQAARNALLKLGVDVNGSD